MHGNYSNYAVDKNFFEDSNQSNYGYYEGVFAQLMDIIWRDCIDKI